MLTSETNLCRDTYFSLSMRSKKKTNKKKNGAPILWTQLWDKISLLASHVPTSSPLTDDDHWVIDTDYDNYAVHYSCRQVDDDGTCLDSYSFIFSRHMTGLRAEDQTIIQQKKSNLCLLNKYRRINHSGETKAKFISLWKGLLITTSLIRRDTESMIYPSYYNCCIRTCSRVK